MSDGKQQSTTKGAKLCTPVPSPPSSDVDPLDMSFNASESGSTSGGSVTDTNNNAKNNSGYDSLVRNGKQKESLKRRKDDIGEKGDVLTTEGKPSLHASISVEKLDESIPKKIRTDKKGGTPSADLVLPNGGVCLPAITQEEKLEKMEAACRTILQCIGEDPDREGLIKTPSRWAKALLHFTKGYAETPETVTNGAVFSEESHQEMVLVKDIDIHSLCEHHMVPFTGKVSIGYVPNGKIIGLSKLARIAEVFGRRLQVQERLTSSIADAIMEQVGPSGVIVTIQCSHFCMVMRGVEKCGAQTVSTCARGCFQTDRLLRAEFMNAVNGK